MWLWLILIYNLSVKNIGIWFLFSGMKKESQNIIQWNKALPVEVAFDKWNEESCGIIKGEKERNFTRIPLSKILSHQSLRKYSMEKIKHPYEMIHGYLSIFKHV